MGNPVIRKPFEIPSLEDEDDNYYNADFEGIPGLILKVWGKISQEDYAELKTNHSWLNLTTKICDECYVKFTQVKIESEIERKTREM